MKDQDFFIIPGLHQRYAVTYDRVYPLKTVPPSSKILPVGPQENRISNQSQELRATIEDPDSKVRYHLPKGVTMEEADNVYDIQTGHEVMSLTLDRCRYNLNYPLTIDEN